jgi:hypothetical protein
MGVMRMKISPTELQQNVGRYQDADIMKGRIARHIEDLDEATIAAIAAAEAPSHRAHLDDELKSA